MKSEYSHPAQDALKRAAMIAITCGHTMTGTGHLLAALCGKSKNRTTTMLTRHGAGVKKMEAAVRKLAPADRCGVFNAEILSNDLTAVCAEAEAEAKKNSESVVSTTHLLLAILKNLECTAVRALQEEKIDVLKLHQSALSLQT